MPIDMSLAATAPPKKRATTGGTSTRIQKNATPQDTRTVNQKRFEGLLGLAQIGQALCVMVGQHADAAAIGMHFPPFGQEIANVADTSDALAKPLDFLIEAGPYGALIATALPFALQIAANHKWIDGNRLAGQGVVPPEVLEAQMQADIAKTQANAAVAKRNAIAEAQKAQAEYDDLVKAA